MNSLFVLLALVDGPLDIPKIQARLSVELAEDNPLCCERSVKDALEGLFGRSLVQMTGTGKIMLEDRGRRFLLESPSGNFIEDQMKKLREGQS